ncbi:MAG: phospho-sugar mutase [Clostridia bacterium]|nr:phospho-sugar mutase [Clostridia bacterium]MBQ6703822.1 phospho-sugar mutase [Clostridia bacterium]
MDYRENYLSWLGNEGLESSLRAELEAIAADAKEQEERFYTELEFGTAGLRGIIGAGTNRMNVHVVRRATQGLADYLNTIPGAKERGVAIAYDSRHMSDVFARETALVLAENGIKSFLYSTLHSVPQLSFTVLHLGCIAGVVITASHNPPEYNGYKVYWEHGGQVGPEQADEILGYIRKADYFDVRPMDEQAALSGGLVKMIGAEVDEEYYKATMSLRLNPEVTAEKGADMKLVYTPLHGSGCVPVKEILKRIGLVNVSIVAEQEAPDGSFPTVKAPNPEDPNAFTLAFELANKVGADLILGTDPDSDRLGAAVRKDDGHFAVLTGNQIGSILIHYILSTMKEKGVLPTNGLVVKSIVSTMMADAICAHYGVEMRHVLTGFRFISEQIEYCEKTGEKSFLFGFEESYGFLAGSFARDKDAICASMMLAEAAVVYAQQGKNLYDVLQEMYELYGYYGEAVKSYTLKGKEGLEKIAAAMESLRSQPMDTVGGVNVLTFEDLRKGIVRHSDGREEKAGLPSSNVLRFFLEEDCWVCVRPSGTEPKLKLYIGGNARSAQGLEQRLAALMADADGRICELLK